MPRLTPAPLHLSEQEREALQHLINRHSTAQQIALRGRIILLADAGKNHREIARQLKISREMARLWRQRWLASASTEGPVAARLADAARPGGPATFTLEQTLQLFALACEKPEDSGRPISHWTSRELADEMAKRGWVERISPRQVGRLLAEADLKPHQSQYWLNPPPTRSLMKRSTISVPST
ncbi:MAG: helix-turn-helix domain-containing protein [Cyanobacteria bacterium J06638_22]